MIRLVKKSEKTYDAFVNHAYLPETTAIVCNMKCDSLYEAWTKANAAIGSFRCKTGFDHGDLGISCDLTLIGISFGTYNKDEYCVVIRDTGPVFSVPINAKNHFKMPEYVTPAQTAVITEFMETVTRLHAESEQVA